MDLIVILVLALLTMYAYFMTTGKAEIFEQPRDTEKNPLQLRTFIK